MQLNLSVMGTLNVNYKAFSAAGVQIIPPFRGPAGSGPLIYDMRTSTKNVGQAITHINTVGYTTLGTAHLIGIMRPFNYTWLTEAMTANDTTAVVYDDPGVYSTNLKYASPLSTGTATVADNAIAGSDYVAIQLLDGTWHVSTVASVSSLTVTLDTATPNITGGGAGVGAPVYFFGVIGNSNPQTGLVNPQTTIAANQTRDVTWTQANAGIVAALNPGDPMLFYTPNTTNNGTLEFISGYYAKV